MGVSSDHTVIIERRGRSHQARCSCGWSSHSWNELRPAEADAWHHIYGDSCVVDASQVMVTAGLRATPPTPAAFDASVDRLVHRARVLADGASPYGEQAVGELRRLAGGDRRVVEASIEQLNEMLRRHDRQSWGTADSEWLQLRTARRILEEALTLEDAP